MDTQTRVGIGAGALFALAGIASPLLGWSVSGPVMGLCAAVALWGFWPFIRVPQLRLRMPIQDAARKAYEAAEREGWLKGVMSDYPDPEARLNTFKTIFMLEAANDLCGTKPPSTREMPIPRDELKRLRPMPGESRFNKINPMDEVAYTNVTISKRSLWRIIRAWRDRQNPE